MKRLITLAAALCLIFGTVFSACAAEEQALKVSLPETVKGYTPCEIRITSPAAGEAVLHGTSWTQQKGPFPCSQGNGVRDYSFP